ncbi:MOSC domain-containing protein [Paraburkholderia sp. SARCC-3016]|uniref:MOSC domain-containing protein n=1 Tax=Paraburkholderia sp. SARCC-3016 TaxID=3058611 RepID=UPI002809C815|nr:MOSC domain-containing protein [Paraburkholderia sp. SARCC-3016]MDQ7978987.1 MOSC domain-containing protein [Paraburkholderia sp. SARCC-3016]
MNDTLCCVDALLMGKVAPLGDSGKRSAIDKHPVTGRVRLDETGLDGDEQADSTHHGGVEKALHHYPFDHYATWRTEWRQRSNSVDSDVSATAAPGVARLASRGAFGENISTLGMNEANVCVGDVYRIGDAIVQLSQPRQPCWKLNLRFSRDDMSRRVQQTLRTGWYYRVLEAGEIGAGDRIERLARVHPQWTVERLLHVLYVDRDDRTALEQMANLDALTPSWRATAAKRLANGAVESWSKRLDTPAD